MQNNPNIFGQKPSIISSLLRLFEEFRSNKRIGVNEFQGFDHIGRAFLVFAEVCGLEMSLVCLPVGIDLKDVNLAGIGLVLHGEKGYNSRLTGHGNEANLRGKAHIIFKFFLEYFNFCEADNPLSILPHWDVVTKEPPGIVGEDGLRGQTQGWKALLKGFFGRYQRRRGHIRVVGAIEDVIGRCDGKERADGIVRCGAGMVRTDVSIPALSINARCSSTFQDGMGKPSSISAPCVRIKSM